MLHALVGRLRSPWARGAHAKRQDSPTSFEVEGRARTLLLCLLLGEPWLIFTVLIRTTYLLRDIGGVALPDPKQLCPPAAPLLQLVLKWEAQRTVCNIRREWEHSTLISCDAGDMARRLARAARAHAFAEKSAGGPDEVSTSCGATLAHLGQMVEAVGFLQNRNLTAAYWERVEQTMPLGEVSARRDVKQHY